MNRVCVSDSGVLDAMRSSVGQQPAATGQFVLSRISVVVADWRVTIVGATHDYREDTTHRGQSTAEQQISFFNYSTMRAQLQPD